MKSAIERLQEKLNSMQGRIGSVTLNCYIEHTAEEVAEELLLMIEAVEREDCQEVKFNDSHGHRND